MNVDGNAFNALSKAWSAERRSPPWSVAKADDTDTADVFIVIDSTGEPVMCTNDRSIADMLTTASRLFDTTRRS